VRALTISAHGGRERIEFRNDVPEPALRGEHDVRIRIAAAALNHLDLFVVEGLPGVTIKPPWVLGADGTGFVESAGTQVTSVAVGDRVVINAGISDRTCEYCRRGEQSLCIRFGILGEHHPGTMAEFVVVPEYNVRRIGPEPPHAEAAAYPLVALTAWRMLVTRAGLREGEDVLIQGIGGGVAQAAFAIAKLRGARTWVTSTSAAKLERLVQMGVDFAIDSNREDVVRTVRERTGKRGVDVVVDSVGAATWKTSLAVMGRNGRLVTCGATSGPVVQTDLRRVFWNGQSVLGSTMGNDHEFDEIVALFRDGLLTPVVDSIHSLEDGRAAFDRLASGEHFGKVVVRVSE
jgi:NADPH:quinone reductase-like Zn-dependent oxidoreductase